MEMFDLLTLSPACTVPVHLFNLLSYSSSSLCSFHHNMSASRASIDLFACLSANKRNKSFPFDYGTYWKGVGVQIIRWTGSECVWPIMWNLVNQQQERRRSCFLVLQGIREHVPCWCTCTVWIPWARGDFPLPRLCWSMHAYGLSKHTRPSSYTYIERWPMFDICAPVLERDTAALFRLLTSRWWWTRWLVALPACLPAWFCVALYPKWVSFRLCTCPVCVCVLSCCHPPVDLKRSIL